MYPWNLSKAHLFAQAFAALDDLLGVPVKQVHSDRLVDARAPTYSQA